ncbi:MAG: ABC transporter family substrate-binding protein, partial [Propionicimonas sp.]|nr:ABC transporter family substrate-binding protein [Propionicimonas sp.]
MKQPKVLLPIIAGGLALVLAACGGPVATPDTSASGSAPATGAPSAEPSDPAASAWDINETPRDQLVQGGEFIGSIGYPISTWNQFNINGNDAELVQLQAPISPAYYDYNGLGEPVINNDYLESATEDVTDGKLTITMKLNPKAVWNDGKVIGADDWIATWKANNGEDRDFAVASSDGWSEIESIKAGADQQEVIITFKSTYPDWTAIVSTGPQRAEGVKDAKTYNDGWADYVDEYFTGPFKVSSWDKTSGTVVMEPNPNWWGDKPLLDKLTWKQIADDAKSAAFANQELDYYDIGPNPAGYQEASSAQNSVVRKSNGPDYRHFTLNSKSPFLDDVNVRQAILMGLDRETIAASDMAGLPEDMIKKLDNNLYVHGLPGYVDQAAATGLDYNPDGAKQKLEGAGWALNSAGFYEKDGKQLDIEFATLGGVSTSENEYVLAHDQLKAIGVNLTQRVVDVSKDWPGVLVEHKFGIVAFSWIGTPYPLNNIGQIYGVSKNKKGEEVPNDSNYAQLRIDKLQELKPLIDNEMDPAK